MITTNKLLFKAVFQGLVALGVGAIVTGCSTYNQRNPFAGYYRYGNLASAETEAVRMADSEKNSKDAIIWRLEEATILRANGKYKESNTAFEMAEAKIDDYANQAKIKLGNEAGAMLSNQANLPYRGRSYDGIMLNTYKSLNYMQLGDLDRARVEINRAYTRQQEAVDANKKRIADAQAEEANSKDKDKVEKARQDPKFKGELDQAYGNLDQLKAYSDYVNPFTVYIQGLYFLSNPAGISDLEKARKSLQRVLAFEQDNKFIKEDLKLEEDLTAGKPFPPTTYVIFETGLAPMREQLRIDIPIIFLNVSYVGAAFPLFRPQEDFQPALNVYTSGGVKETTQLVASMDSVVGTDFKNEMPVIITKTLVATIAKAAASYAITEAAEKGGGDVGKWVARLGTLAYGVAVNIADLRTWTTLPKQFQVCRIPTPADRKIDLQTAGGGQRITVTLNEGTVNVIYAKSITSMSPLFVSQMKLK